MNLIVFGDNSSPCEAPFGVQRTAEDNKEQWPAAVATRVTEKLQL